MAAHSVSRGMESLRRGGEVVGGTPPRLCLKAPAGGTNCPPEPDILTRKASISAGGRFGFRTPETYPSTKAREQVILLPDGQFY